MAYGRRDDATNSSQLAGLILENETGTYGQDRKFDDTIEDTVWINLHFIFPSLPFFFTDCSHFKEEWTELNKPNICY